MLVTVIPTHGEMDPGWPCKTIFKTLMEDTGAASTSELSIVMEERAA